MRVAVVIPSRGMERVGFLKNAMRMILSQTLTPVKILVMSDPPLSEKPDITYRYRTAYTQINPNEIDVIAFWEDDDHYMPHYLEYMVKSWQENDCPDLFGNLYTIYYNLRIRKYFTWRHENRASMMNTLMRPGLKLVWPEDHDPYTDQWLWKLGALKRKVHEPSHIVSVGIKHGIGKTGGVMHVDKFQRYINDDPDHYWLKTTLDEESYKFYSSVAFE